MSHARPPLPLTSPEEKALTDAAVRFLATPEQASPREQALLEDLERQLRTQAMEPERAAALLMQTANAVLDEEGLRLAGIFEQRNSPIVCHPGCFSCCCQLVRCTPFDAVLIKLYLAERQDAAARFEAAYAQWDAATATMRPGYLRWAERCRREGVDDGSHRFQDYFVRCPFLDAADRCSIYPVRPYCCRSCIAVDSACHSPAAPLDVPGMRNMLYGDHTPHQAARDALTGVLWRWFGLEPVEPGRAAFIPMVELVHRLLRAGLPETLVWAMRP